MRSVETEGETIDAAVETALRELGLGREAVTVEVLDEGGRSLLGLRSRLARVRVTEKPQAPRESVSESSPPKSAATETVDAALGAPSGQLPTSRDPIERAKSFVQELIILLGCTAQLSVRANETPVVFELSGADAGFLIGRHGQMLDAIEYLANRVAVSEPVESARILVDAQGYRERRRLYLEGLAKRLGAQVRSRKKSVTLEPMSPRDRRTVHVALQNEPGVVTKSTGEGYYRRVVISPAEPAGSRSRPSRS